MMAPTLRILLVEDEPLNLALLRAILQRAADERLRNAEVVEARTLTEGRVRLAESDYDMILLDRRLPDGDGFQLARELRAAAKPGSPIIVALTADAIPATQQDATAAGCTSLLIKPFRPAELTRLLPKLLDEFLSAPPDDPR